MAEDRAIVAKVSHNILLLAIVNEIVAVNFLLCGV